MARSRFENNTSNLYFLDYTKDDKSDKGCKVRSLINHFKQILSNSVSIDDSQSIDEYMVKFKGRSSMKQYVKNNSIKWGFKFWHRCASETEHLPLGKKESAEENLRPGIALKMTESLQNSYCIVFFFFIISSIFPHL